MQTSATHQLLMNQILPTHCCEKEERMQCTNQLNNLIFIKKSKKNAGVKGRTNLLWMTLNSSLHCFVEEESKQQKQQCKQVKLTVCW